MLYVLVPYRAVHTRQPVHDLEHCVAAWKVVRKVQSKVMSARVALERLQTRVVVSKVWKVILCAEKIEHIFVPARLQAKTGEHVDSAFLFAVHRDPMLAAHKQPRCLHDSLSR